MSASYQEYNLPYGRIKMLLHSQNGNYHIENGLASQDCCGFVYNDNKMVLAIADGVGSCSHADDGSEKAIMAAENLISLSEFSNETIVKSIWNHWVKNIDFPANECCSTLHFAVILPEEIIIGGIGDGVKYCSTDTGFCRLHDDDGFVNSTYALPMQEQFEIRRYKMEPMIIVMLTDGISNEINQDTEEVFCHYLRNTIKMNPQALQEEVKNWISSLQEKNGDDKTIALLSIEC